VREDASLGNLEPRCIKCITNHMCIFVGRVHKLSLEIDQVKEGCAGQKN